jgi:hypothetical protein
MEAHTLGWAEGYFGHLLSHHTDARARNDARRRAPNSNGEIGPRVEARRSPSLGQRERGQCNERSTTLRLVDSDPILLCYLFFRFGSWLS